MVQQRRVGVLVSLALIVVSVSMPRHAIADGGVSADLSGVPIGIEDIARYHCHDLDYPRMRCFETVDGLVLELERRLSAGPGFGSASDGPLGTLAVNYVWAFADATYAGASVFLSIDHSDLGTIGWNDRISSFKGQNYQTGRFWEHNLFRGARYDFCCNVQVPWIGSAWNDRISSAEVL